MAQIKFQNKLRKKSKKPLYTHFQQSMTSTKDYSNLSLTMATQLKNTFMKQKTTMSTVYLEFQVKEVPNLKKIGVSVNQLLFINTVSWTLLQVYVLTDSSQWFFILRTGVLMFGWITIEEIGLADIMYSMTQMSMMITGTLAFKTWLLMISQLYLSLCWARQESKRWLISDIVRVQCRCSQH